MILTEENNLWILGLFTVLSFVSPIRIFAEHIYNYSVPATVGLLVFAIFTVDKKQTKRNAVFLHMLTQSIT